MTHPISVIIVNWNGKHLLSDCLSSLQKQTYKNFEIILVDNGSSDGSIEWIDKHYPQVKVISLKENLGFAGGNNIGILASQGKFITLLNNDTEVDQDWLKQLYLQINKDESIAACDSKVYYYTDRNLIWAAGGTYSIAGTSQMRGNLEENRAVFNEPCEIFTAIACAAIYRKSAFEDIGLLDEDFHSGYEDVDWSFRAHLRGYRIVNAPAAQVYHKVSATHGYNSPAFVRNGQRNVFYVYIKNMPLPLLLRYWPFHFFYSIASMVYFARIGQLVPFLFAKLEAALHLPVVLRKRREVQSNRRVSSKAIDDLLTREWLGLKFKKFLSVRDNSENTTVKSKSGAN
jgi:GT2 family glycosyltransferase